MHGTILYELTLYSFFAILWRLIFMSPWAFLRAPSFRSTIVALFPACAATCQINSLLLIHVLIQAQSFDKNSIWPWGNGLVWRSKVRGFKPSWGWWIFSGHKNPEHKSSRRDFKLISAYDVISSHVILVMQHHAAAQALLNICKLCFKLLRELKWMLGAEIISALIKLS